MNQKGQFYSSKEAAAEILRQLEEDFDSDTEQKENEVSLSGEANIAEEVMDGIIPESSISNTVDSLYLELARDQQICSR